MKMAPEVDKISSRMLPPHSVKGMKVLDRSQFSRTTEIPALAIPFKSMKKGMKSPMLKQKLLKIRDYKSVSYKEAPGVDGETEKCKIVLLKPGTILNEVEKEHLKGLGIVPELHQHTIDLSYKNFSHVDILNAILTDEEDTVRGFSQSGHIIHVNLRDCQLPYKNLIGQVLLDKTKTARTVVNKLGMIDNEYRNFQLEVLAGEEDFVATVGEHGCKFQFDFSKVFWNSRLQTEHQRIVDLSSPDDVIFDGFAGVGPFAVPLAKKGCKVYANDLNPDSYVWLKKNAEINKVKVEAYNKDGGNFIRENLKDHLLKRAKQGGVGKESEIRVLMNLPKIAITFLKSFRDIISDDDIVKNNIKRESIPKVTVHCYSFAPEDSTVEHFDPIVAEELKTKVGDEGYKITAVTYVRNIAPTKAHYCVTIQVGYQLVSSLPLDADKEEEPATKRVKLDSK